MGSFEHSPRGLHGLAASSREDARSQLISLLLCAIALLYAFPYQPRINNPNENVRFYMTAAIVEHGSYAIDDLRKRWGWVNDAGVRDGHYYSVKAPGTSLAGVPGYALYRGYTQLFGRPFDRTSALWTCRISAQVLPTVLWLHFFQLFLARFSAFVALRLAVVFSLLLGSLLYGYTLIFVSHSASALAACAVFMLLHERRDVGVGRAFAAGLCAALVTLFEYPGVVFSLPLALYALFIVGLRRAPFVCAGGALPTLAMMHFQWRAWGHPLTPGHQFLENPSYRALSQQGFFGATGFDVGAVRGLLLDLGYGLFPLTPLLVLALPGAIIALRSRRSRALTVTSLAGSLMTVVAIGAMNNWRGGWTIGPRYLAVVYPVLGVLALVALDTLARRAPRLAHGVAIGATATALGASGLLSAYYPHVPEALERPVRDLLWPLLRYDFAPFNAGQAFGLYGTLSMVPVFVTFCAAIGLLFAVTARALGAKALRVSGFVALLSCATTLIPLVSQETVGAPAQKALALVTKLWSPPGHDALSILQATEPAGRDARWEQRVKVVSAALGRAGEAPLAGARHRP